MTDRKTLDLAREWAKWAKDNPSVPVGHIRDLPRAAADLIASLPDTIVDGDELREVVADHHMDMSDELMEALGALLPAPPTMAEIEWDDEEHRLAEATVPELFGRPNEKVLMLKIDDLGHIRSLDPTTWEMWSLSPGRLTPTGRRYRLEPEDDKPAPEPASPRPDGCCGACPEIVGGGYDCTCADNPRCPNHQPRPEDVPVDEPWQVEVGGKVAIGYRNDPDDKIPWIVVYPDRALHDYLFDNDVTLVSRLVPKTTEQGYEAVLDPAYTYTDRDGDEWEHLDGKWVAGDTHDERVDNRKFGYGRDSLPEWFGPYTRIEKEETNE